MTTIRRLTAVAVLVITVSMAGVASAQSTEACPSLPDDSGLSWKALQSPDLVFCKALRDADGTEVFAVTIAATSPFKPSRSDRDDRTVIDGHEGYWYRSEIASAPLAQVRETLIELSDGRVAHVTVRAPSAEQLPAALQQAQSVRFTGTRLSSN